MHEVAEQSSVPALIARQLVRRHKSRYFESYVDCVSVGFWDLLKAISGSSAVSHRPNYPRSLDGLLTRLQGYRPHGDGATSRSTLGLHVECSLLGGVEERLAVTVRRASRLPGLRRWIESAH